MQTSKKVDPPWSKEGKPWHKMLWRSSASLPFFLFPSFIFYSFILLSFLERERERERELLWMFVGWHFGGTCHLNDDDDLLLSYFVDQHGKQVT
jgi:hypothetical protein